MRVLVTRPQPGADRTAARLRAMGHEPVLLPLSRTVAIADRPDVDANSSAGAWAVTSAAAFEYWTPPEPGGLGVPLYAVGGRTASQALAAGFTDVREGPGTGRDLARMIVAEHDSGRLVLSGDLPLVYIAGRVRKKVFEAGLTGQNVPYRTLEVYDIQKISYPTDFIFATFGEEPPDAVLFYSANAASAFFDSICPVISSRELKRMGFFCISEDVADVVRRAIAVQCRVASHPDEDQLLSLL